MYTSPNLNLLQMYEATGVNNILMQVLRLFLHKDKCNYIEYSLILLTVVVNYRQSKLMYNV